MDTGVYKIDGPILIGPFFCEVLVNRSVTSKAGRVKCIFPYKTQRSYASETIRPAHYTNSQNTLATKFNSYSKHIADTILRSQGRGAQVFFIRDFVFFSEIIW